MNDRKFTTERLFSVREFGHHCDKDVTRVSGFHLLIKLRNIPRSRNSYHIGYVYQYVRDTKWGQNVRVSISFYIFFFLSNY